MLGQRARLDHVPAARVHEIGLTLKTFWVSAGCRLCGPNRRSPPMSMSPMLSRVAMKTGSAVEVLAWTFWPMRVRLKPPRWCSIVLRQDLRGTSAVKNWFAR